MSSNSSSSPSAVSASPSSSASASQSTITTASPSVTSVTSASLSVSSSVSVSAGLTTTLPVTTSVIVTTPSTTYVVETTPVVPTTVVSEVTITTRASASGSTQPAVVTTITSYQSVSTNLPVSSTSRTSTASSSTSSTSQTALSAGSGSNGTNGLSTGATVAIAVIIPLLAVIAGILFGLWLWRRRNARKENAEQVKNDMAEYHYNPNDDPTLPVGAAYTDNISEAADESGYRGWGQTSTQRKPSTTLGSTSRAAALAGVAGIGTATSDHGSQSYNAQPSPSNGASEHTANSEYPLMNHAHSESADGLTTLGAAAAGATTLAATRSRSQRNSLATSGIHRGPSNASSAYSAAALSDADSDIPDMPQQRPYYQEEIPYNIYNDPSSHQHHPGSSADTSYAGIGQAIDQPVIRDVQARRNTRIERVPTFPSSASGGIAQNF